MLDLVCAWLGSIIVNYYIKNYNKINFCKYIAERGYKVNVRKMEELKKITVDNIESIKKIALSFRDFTFLYGMLINFDETLSQEDNIYLLKLLAKYNLLLKLTEEEKETFLKDPIGKNAYIIFYKYYIKIKSSPFVYVWNNDQIAGKIYYELENVAKSNSIVILEAEGFASSMTLEEQIEYVKRMRQERLEFTSAFTRERINKINQ